MRCSLKARWPTGPAVTRHFVGICELFQIKAHSKFCSCGRNCSNIRLNCVILCDLLISIDNWLRRDCLWQSTKKQKFQIERKKGELCVYVQKCCCVFGIFFCCSSQNCYRAMFGGRNGASNDPEIDIFINFERSKPVGTHFVASEISEHHSQSNVCAAFFFLLWTKGEGNFYLKLLMSTLSRIDRHSMYISHSVPFERFNNTFDSTLRLVSIDRFSYSFHISFYYLFIILFFIWYSWP